MRATASAERRIAVARKLAAKHERAHALVHALTLNAKAIVPMHSCFLFLLLDPGRRLFLHSRIILCLTFWCFPGGHLDAVLDTEDMVVAHLQDCRQARRWAATAF